MGGGVAGKTTLLPDNEWVREVAKEDVAVDFDDEDKPVIPSEPLKTLLSLVVLVTGFIATTTSLALTHDRVPDTAPLPDIVLDTVILVVILHTHRLIILRRIWLLLGILYYYRAVTMFITVLPKADKFYTCQPRSHNITAGLVVERV